MKYNFSECLESSFFCCVILDVHDNQQCSLNLVDYQVEVNCNCHHTYFQLAILARDTSIISKRSSCSQTVRVILNPDESFEYSAIVFIEDENDSIFTSRDSIIVMEFSVQQPTSTIGIEYYILVSIVHQSDAILHGASKS